MNKTTSLFAHQCYFGEMDRGHGLICASFDDKNLVAFLSRVTDLPINKPADVQLNTFYGCHSYKSLIIFTKTFSDHQSSRSGMVFTHAIIIESNLLVQLHNLEDVFSQFITEIPVYKPDQLDLLPIPATHALLPISLSDQASLRPILNFLLSDNENQYLVIPLENQWPVLYINLWNSIVPALRHQLTIRLSFNPNDVQPNDYQLYYTPSSLLMRWPQQRQYEAYKTTANDLPLISQFLLQANEAAPLVNFLQELNYKVKDFKDLSLIEHAFTSYVRLADISTSKLLQLLRSIVVLSPSKMEGEQVKKLVVAKLVEALNQPQTNNFLLLSLANIDLTTLAVSASVLGDKVTTILGAWWIDDEIELVEETLQRRLEAQSNSWWNTAIDDELKKVFNKISAYDAQKSWNLWLNLEKAVTYFWGFIKHNESAEHNFVATLPKKLHKDIRAQLVPLVKHQNWFRLHASIIVQYLDPDQALSEQIALNSVDRPSLLIVAQQFKPAAFIQTAISYNNSVLTEIALEMPVKMGEVMQYINIKDSAWHEFILAKLQQVENRKRTINEFEPILTLLLDELIDKDLVQDKLLAAFAQTSLADLSDYHQRALVWEKLPVAIRKSFLIATGSSLLEHLTNAADLEPALKEAMLSLNIAGGYMNTHAASWSDIMRIFELFPSLPEHYLSDHLNYSSQIDTDANATRLGMLIKRKNWRSCANIVYQKAKFNSSYKPALGQCLELLDFWQKAKVKYTFTNMPKTLSLTNSEWLFNFENLCIALYDDEIEIRIIWQKAGGKVAQLRSKDSAQVIWHHALQDLKKGKMKGLTFKSLLQEMMDDRPAKRDQLQILFSALNDLTTIE